MGAPSAYGGQLDAGPVPASRAAPSPSLGLRLLKGLEINVFGQVAALALNLALTPRIVRGLGPEGYALYTLMFTLLSYLLNLNAGTGAATQFYAARYGGSADSKKLNPLLRTAVAFHVLVSLAGAALLLATRGWVFRHWVHAQGPMLGTVPRAIACVALSAPAYLALQASINALYGLQRFKAYNALLTSQTAAVGVSAVALLAAGRGLPQIALAFVAVQWVLAATGLWCLRDALRPQGPPGGQELRGFFSYSFKSYFAQVLWTLIYQGDRLFVAALLPLADMGYYAISSSTAQKFNAFLGTVPQTAFPMLAELHGRGESERIKRLYLKTTELSLFLMLPASILSFVLVPQFMTLWLGPDFSLRSTWPFRVLLLANVAYLSVSLPNSVAMGRGAPHLSAYLNAARASLLLLTWPWFIPRWGILGAALGLLVAEWCVTPVFLSYVHRRFLGVSWWEYWSQGCMRPVLAGLGPAALAFLAHGRIGSWAGLLGFGAAGSLVFFGAGYWSLDAGARELLERWRRERFARPA